MESHLIKKRFEALKPFLDERLRRIFTAAEARAIGYGGVSIVARETGVSRRAIALGCQELEELEKVDEKRIRKKGGGRKRAVDRDPNLPKHLESLMEPVMHGVVESPLRWTCKSVRMLSDELNLMGHKSSHNLVAALLRELGYRLQGNKRILGRASPSERNAQFEYINNKVLAYQADREPVIFVEIKRKEFVGNLEGSRQPLRPISNSGKIQAKAEISTRSYQGEYELVPNAEWVNVDMEDEDFVFAVESIRRWCHAMKPHKYPKARSLLIISEICGYVENPMEVWKLELEKLATETGLSISVCIFPPGTSRWNKIEHRLWSYFEEIWDEKSIIGTEVMLSLIAGASIKLGPSSHLKGLEVSDVKTVSIAWESFLVAWNYSIFPRRS
jgi:hypothetical protein